MLFPIGMVLEISGNDGFVRAKFVAKLAAFLASPPHPTKYPPL